MVELIRKGLLHVHRGFFSLILVWCQQERSFSSLALFPISMTATNTWSRHSSTGPAPKALSMSGVLCDNKMVTFGGVLSGKGCNSVHFLDLGKYTFRNYNKDSIVKRQYNIEVTYCALQSLWNGVPSVLTMQGLNRGTVHSAVAAIVISVTMGCYMYACNWKWGILIFLFRCDHSCAVVGQTVFVCAGTGSDELWFNDLHQLSVASLHWREVEQKGNPPSPRDYSTLVAINDWVSWSWSNLIATIPLSPLL